MLDNNIYQGCCLAWSPQLFSLIYIPVISNQDLQSNTWFFASLACWYLNEITQYSVQPNNSVNIRLQNPDIRLKRIIRFKSSIRFLINQIPL